MITLAYVGRIIWINQRIKRKVNMTTNNLETKLINNCRVRVVQEYIIYFIWQVVYEIACHICNLLFQKNSGGKLLPIEMGIYI